jgi:hypothetical protein
MRALETLGDIGIPFNSELELRPPLREFDKAWIW